MSRRIRIPSFLGGLLSLLPLFSSSVAAQTSSSLPLQLSSTHSFQTTHRDPLRPRPEAEAEVALAFTSDLHGNLQDTQGRPSGLLHLAQPLRKLRGLEPNLLLIDVGDTLQGSPENHYFSRIRPRSAPLPVIQVMNALRYDAVVLGNHDFDPPPKVLLKSLQHSRFPWLAANLTFNDQPVLPPYVVLERSGVRIGLLGAITPGVPLWVDPEHRAELEFEDLSEVAKRWVPVLREQEQVDLVVALLHSGAEVDYDRDVARLAGLPDVNAAGVVADFAEGVDLIVSGHAHRVFPKRPTSRLTRYRTPLVSPGSRAEGVMVSRVRMHERSGRWELAGMEFQWVPAAALPDPELLQVVKPDLEEVAQWLEVPTRWRFQRRPSREELDACGPRLQHQAVVEALGGDFTLLPAWWFWRPLPSAEVGQPLRRRHLFGWIRYDNTLVQALQAPRQLELWQEPWRRWQSGKRVRYHALLKLRGPQEVPEDEVAVWFTNYHWNGGSGLAFRTLRQRSQELQRRPQTLREVVFEHLRSDATSLPAECSFLE